jgi:hypothetical protein
LEGKTRKLKVLFIDNLKYSSAWQLEHKQSKDEARMREQGFSSCIKKMKVLYVGPKGMFGKEIFLCPQVKQMLMVIMIIKGRGTYHDKSKSLMKPLTCGKI